MTELRTFGGEPSTPEHWHCGYPVSDEEVLARPNGYPAYRPADPVSSYQRPYVEYAAKREQAS